MFVSPHTLFLATLGLIFSHLGYSWEGIGEEGETWARSMKDAPSASENECWLPRRPRSHKASKWWVFFLLPSPFSFPPFHAPACPICRVVPTKCFDSCSFFNSFPIQGESNTLCMQRTELSSVFAFAAPTVRPSPFLVIKKYHILCRFEMCLTGLVANDKDR